ncbi:hypothetical protein WMF16_27840 [Sorangium sp. So ce388]
MKASICAVSTIDPGIPPATTFSEVSRENGASAIGFSGNALRANVLPAALAILALHARATDRAEGDALAHPEPRRVDARPDRRDRAGDLVARYERVLRHAPFVVHHADVRVADPAMGHGHVDLAGTELSRLVLERQKAGLGGPGSVGPEAHGVTSDELMSSHDDIGGMAPWSTGVNER